jgi:hypothetical protein
VDQQQVEVEVDQVDGRGIRSGKFKVKYIDDMSTEKSLECGNDTTD